MGQIKEVDSVELAIEACDYARSLDLKEPPTQDSYVVDALGKDIPDMTMGIFLLYYDGDEIKGILHSNIGVDRSTIYVSEFYARDGKDELYQDFLDRCGKHGIKRVIWHVDDPWTVCMEEIHPLSSDTSLDFAVLDLESGEVKKETLELPEVCTVYHDKPRMTDVICMEDLQQCLEVQLGVNWGEFSIPPRQILPDAFLHLIGHRIGYMVVSRDEEGKIVGFVRISATFTPGCFYGHEGVVLPEYQSKGYGTLMSSILSAIVLREGGKKAYGTIDPTNLKSLALSLRQVGMYGVRLEENLFGAWATEENVGGDTDRIILVFDAANEKPRTGSKEAPSIKIDEIRDSPEKIEGLDDDIYLSWGMDFETLDKRGRDVKQKATRALKPLMNDKGYILTNILFDEDDVRYFLTKP